jgi:MoaA/NifB/PqqE/SkfB family radical SAM enzyme/16S rRNA C1402 (ribose-2'-O) methylase RsmI
MHSLILIPWHIGNRRDITVNAVGRMRSLHWFLAENPEAAKREFSEMLSGNSPANNFILLPETADPEVLARVCRLLETEDVGLIASGGAPCFVDPGAWLVRALRQRGVPIVSQGGASILSAIFSLSGVEWIGRPNLASIMFFAQRYSADKRSFLEALRRQDDEQPVIVLLQTGDFEACLRALRSAIGARQISVFFDVTKDRRKYPYADQVRTLSCPRWLEEARALDWERISEIALMIHPLVAGGLSLTADVFGTYEAQAKGSQAAPGHEAILRVSFACNQACGFCFVDLSGRLVPVDEIERELDSMRPEARRAEYLVISGGEPAAHPRLPDIVELCRRKGFRDILVQTNAVHLSKRSLALKLGRLSFLVSLHSHVSQTYDELTRSKSQLPLALKGIRNILAIEGNRVIVNVVVNSLNYAELPAFVDFLDELRRPHPIVISFSMLNDIGLIRTPKLGIDLGKAAPFLDEAVSRCRTKGVEVASFTGDCSIPVCQLSEPEGRASKSVYSQDDVFYRAKFERGESLGRAKSPQCRSCRYDGRCRGVPIEYARRFGLAALEPAAV